MADKHDYDAMSIEELEDLGHSYAEEVAAVKTEWRKLVAVLDAKRIAASDAESDGGDPPQVLEAFQIESEETVDGIG
jgi:hypothetical protein